MTGINATFKDGISARVVEIRVLETYLGILAGTYTVATRHRLRRMISQMEGIVTCAISFSVHSATELNATISAIQKIEGIKEVNA